VTDFFRTYGFLIVTMTIQAVLALSLYLPLMAGQLSLASPGFYALGGYTAAIMSTQFFPQERGLFPIHYLLIEILVSAVICVIVAVIVGFISLRLRGIYLALATIAFVEIIRVTALNLVDITGGAPGIAAVPQPFSTQFGYILITLPILIGATFFVYRLERIRLGRAFTALREDELVASSIGIEPMYHKVLAFSMGAVLAGVAGAISAHLFNTWNPSYGTFDASILLLAYVLVGGSRTVFGPVAGALLLTALPEGLRAAASIPGLPGWFAKFLKDGRLIIYGVLLTVGTLFFPQGLLGSDLFRQRNKRNTATPAQPVGSVIPEAQE
jgi:branched-chain amino acid transport system permease protein